MSGSSAFPGLHHVDFGNDQAEDDEGGQIGASADDEDDVIAVGRIAQRYEVAQDEVTASVALSTALALVTLPVVLLAVARWLV